MILGWLILAPSGVLVGRFGRTLFPARWFPTHRVIQSSAFIAIFIGFFLAVGAISVTPVGHFSDKHMKLGLALVILLLCQSALGQICHALFRKERLRRPVQNWAHVLLGLALIGLSVWEVHLGLEEWRVSRPLGYGVSRLVCDAC